MINNKSSDVDISTLVDSDKELNIDLILFNSDSINEDYLYIL